MKRFNIVPTAHGNIMRESPRGEYVYHEVAADLRRQLAEVTRERDTLKAMVELHDALNDRRRAIADNERRTIRGR